MPHAAERQSPLSSASFVRRLYVKAGVVCLRIPWHLFRYLWLLHLRMVRPNQIVQMGYRRYVPKNPKYPIPRYHGRDSQASTPASIPGMPSNPITMNAPTTSPNITRLRGKAFLLSME